MWRALVRSGQLGSGCLVLRADTRENPGGKNEVMTPRLADQLVASQEDSARKRGNVGGKILEFLARPYFVGLFSRAW
jgi:hypothetical protein